MVSATETCGAPPSQTKVRNSAGALCGRENGSQCVYLRLYVFVPIDLRTFVRWGYALSYAGSAFQFGASRVIADNRERAITLTMRFAWHFS